MLDLIKKSHLAFLNLCYAFSPLCYFAGFVMLFCHSVILLNLCFSARVAFLFCCPTEVSLSIDLIGLYLAVRNKLYKLYSIRMDSFQY